jgi:hypothetical protein
VTVLFSREHFLSQCGKMARQSFASKPDGLAAKMRLIDELRGCTAGGASMCDLLLEERRQDRKRELAKDGW